MFTFLKKYTINFNTDLIENILSEIQLQITVEPLNFFFLHLLYGYLNIFLVTSSDLLGHMLRPENRQPLNGTDTKKKFT